MVAEFRQKESVDTKLRRHDNLVHPRIPFPHLLRLLARRSNLNQGTFPDSRAPARGLVPLPAAFHQLRPERENAALGGLRRMNRAAVITQEPAHGIAWHSQAHLVSGAGDKLAFECRRGHPQKPGHARQVGFGQVHEACLAATFGTSGLALKTQPLSHVSL